MFRCCESMYSNLQGDEFEIKVFKDINV
jgi:hypothetical protein